MLQDAIKLRCDFLNNEKISFLSNRALGCYIKLILFCFENGSIPSENSKIARICGENEEEILLIWKDLLPLFSLKSGRYFNHDICEQLDDVAQVKKQKSLAGKKGACARWGKDIKLDIREFDYKCPKYIEIIDWEAYLDLRRKKRAPISKHAINLVIITIQKLKESGHSPSDVIKQSILNGWVGIYPIKELKGMTNGKSKSELFREGVLAAGRRKPIEINSSDSEGNSIESVPF